MLKKNNGQVLIIVLFILTISFILITGLFSLSVNTRKQISHTDIEMQITNAAEMGISLFDNIFSNVIQANDYKTLKDLLQQLNDHLIPLKGVRTLDSNLSYKISNVDVSSSSDPSKKTTIITLKVTSQGIFKDSTKTLDKTYTLTVPNGNGGDSSGGTFTDKNQFSTINNSNFPTLSPALNGKLTPAQNIKNCQFNGDVSFDFKDVMINTCDYVIDGNAKFDAFSFSFLTKFSISKDALFNGIYYFGYQSELNIGGNAIFNDKVYQNLIFQYYRQALTVNGNSRFNNSVQLNYSKNTLMGNSFFYDTLILYGSNLSIGKNVYFNNKVSLFPNRDPYNLSPSTITIEGSAYFNNNLYVSPSSSIIINGNFYTNQSINVDGTVCVNGSSDITDTSTDANIIQNATSCGRSPGTIYILNKPVQTDDKLDNSNIVIDSSNVQYH